MENSEVSNNSCHSSVDLSQLNIPFRKTVPKIKIVNRSKVIYCTEENWQSEFGSADEVHSPLVLNNDPSNEFGNQCESSLSSQSCYLLLNNKSYVEHAEVDSNGSTCNSGTAGTKLREDYNSADKLKDPNESLQSVSKWKRSLKVKTSKETFKLSPRSSTHAKGKTLRKPIHEIYDHIAEIPSEKGNLYNCNICKKRFKTRAHVKYHKFCVDVSKPFRCDICKLGFIAKSQFDYHLRRHTGERPFLCPVCGKGFSQEGKVARHMLSHTREKPYYVCEICNRGFRTKQALQEHIVIHKGERPFECKTCGKRFTGRINLRKHCVIHSGQRPFSCDNCGKSFNFKWNRDDHLRKHSSERYHACEQCDRTFFKAQDLRRHQANHSDERKFKCLLCKWAFKRQDNLQRHVKVVHGPKEPPKSSKSIEERK